MQTINEKRPTDTNCNCSRSRPSCSRPSLVLLRSGPVCKCRPALCSSRCPPHLASEKCVRVCERESSVPTLHQSRRALAWRVQTKCTSRCAAYRCGAAYVGCIAYDTGSGGEQLSSVWSTTVTSAPSRLSPIHTHNRCHFTLQLRAKVIPFQPCRWTRYARPLATRRGQTARPGSRITWESSTHATKAIITAALVSCQSSLLRLICI